MTLTLAAKGVDAKAMTAKTGPRCEGVKAGREDAVRRCWPKTRRCWPRRCCLWRCCPWRRYRKTLAQDAKTLSVETLSEDAGPSCWPKMRRCWPWRRWLRRCWPRRRWPRRCWPRRRCPETLALDAGPRRGDAGRGDAGHGDAVRRRWPGRGDAVRRRWPKTEDVKTPAAKMLAWRHRPQRREMKG